MSRVRAPFPPGLGLLGWVAALAVATLVSVLAAVPRYSVEQISSAPGSPVQGPQPIVGPPATAGPRPSATSAQGPNALIPSAGSPSGGAASGGVGCNSANNGGSTAPGVTRDRITVASTVVTTGIGEGFLGQAGDGILAAFKQANKSGGICGRQLVFEQVNSGWDGPTGQRTIQSFISSGNVFALVGQPDSEGLAAAIDSGLISRSKMPVVGTDGLLKNQYFNPWVWPVAASTVTNMHIVADYAVNKLGAKSFGIVYDTRYKFGAEGAAAFNNEIKRLTGKDIPGFGGTKDCKASNRAYCGVSSDSQDYTREIQAFNSACAPCDAVVMLLEPSPMQTWMKQEEGAPAWYKTLFGGEPLFDDKVAQNCGGCGKAKMIVWTGYRPAIQPFDSEPAVATFCQALKAQKPSADCHNAFTEGAYLGATLFVEAVREVGRRGLALTRDNLRTVLNSTRFDLGLASAPLQFSETLPHLTNVAMAAFQENYSGSFNGWSYLNTGFLTDRSRLKDLQ